MFPGGECYTETKSFGRRRPCPVLRDWEAEFIKHTKWAALALGLLLTVTAALPMGSAAATSGTVSSMGTVVIPGYSQLVAKPTTQKLYLMASDGETVQEVTQQFEIYNINYNNYMRLRDVAYLLDYEVQFNKNRGSFTIEKMNHATAYGISVDKAFQEKIPSPGTSTIYVGFNEYRDLNMYLIGGEYYIRLRDLAKAADFGCVYSKELKAVVLSPFFTYTENDVMTEGEKVVPEYTDGSGSQCLLRDNLFA